MRQELELEIFEVLKAVSESYSSGPSEARLKEYAKCLSKYHHPSLFRFLWQIPSLFGEFPTRTTLEASSRKALGLDPLKGMSEEMIEKNTEALLREGIPADKVEAGANFLKRSLGIGAPPPKREIPETTEELLSSLDLEF